MLSVCKQQIFVVLGAHKKWVIFSILVVSASVGGKKGEAKHFVLELVFMEPMCAGTAAEARCDLAKTSEAT